MSIDDTLQGDFFSSALSEDDFDTLSNESHHGSSSISQSPDFFGLPSDLMEDWPSSFPDLDMLLDATGSELESFDSNGLDPGVIPDVTVPRPDASLELQPQLWRDDPVMEEFFLKNGASRPPVPCDYCRRRKLQCFLIQTTPSNPNPTTACSSCVGLYRECSLARNLKRQPLAYETSRPVINHLHGINEEGTTPTPDERPARSRHMSGPGSTLRKTSGSRIVKKTRALRKWLAIHTDHPYPTEEEKSELVSQSGLTRTQVVNWFNNARRRQRHLEQLESQSSRKIFRSGSPMPQPILAGASPSEAWELGPSDQQMGLGQDIEYMGNIESDGQSCSGSYTGSSASEQSFLTPDLFGQDVWRVDRAEPECVFCGHECPDDEHFQTHEFELCAERPETERTFKRKDHLWQHLYKFHGCRRWAGWVPDLGRLRRRQKTLDSRCGFCQGVMSTWDDRANHLAAHFKSGLTMAQWVGNSGLEAMQTDSIQ
ncbi:hypothetical protein N3K66_003277 [Trichothecium roseum]|uniref:Uncharacterized protein n=1 Tax=Trichothecium roseum TaxID=47278 RepID=A0ACC0V6A8_9HYPO|nr:hypothetical protein N3K66_003277 [Trichothecium roseum]